jgi:hypothetical protein
MKPVKPILLKRVSFITPAYDRDDSASVFDFAQKQQEMILNLNCWGN